MEGVLEKNGVDHLLTFADFGHPNCLKKKKKLLEPISRLHDLCT